ncbi:MAG: hypothetical protein HZA93_30250 [Verrucomicrobia bacterium]|nr:hypothetical protein [Verrucomicrobiota bacterium]
MNAPSHPRRGLNSGPGARRAAAELRAPLLIAAGLIGVPLAIAIANYFDDDKVPGGAGATEPPKVDDQTSYPMNHFLPGAGYYHAPFGAWFPLPFNTHDPARGWFRGGQWRPTAQEDDAERKEVQRTSGFAPSNSSTTSSGTRVMSSRPSPQAVQKANTGATTQHKANVMRGGFGSSSRPGIS